MPRYLLSTHRTVGATLEPMTDEQMQKAREPIQALEAEMKSAGPWVFSARLHDPTRPRSVGIPPAALALLPPGEKVIVDFNDGIDTKWRSQRPVDRERRLLRQVRFGLHAFPGVILRCSVAGVLVIVKATPLPVPQAVEGRPPLLLQYNNESSRTANFERLDTGSSRAARSLTSQIAEVFRARGRATADGGRALTSSEILTAILGPMFGPAESLPIVLALQGGDNTTAMASTCGTHVSPGARVQAIESGSQRSAVRSRPAARPSHRAADGPDADPPPPPGLASDRRQGQRVCDCAAHQPHGRPPSGHAPPGLPWVEPYQIGTREEEAEVAP